jgi:hypothetical protein
VTAPALVYHFGSIKGFRAAVADAFLERAAIGAGVTPVHGPVDPKAPRPPAAPAGSRFAPPPPRGRPNMHDVASAWITYAAENPALYRLASGETWHGAHGSRSGWHSAVPSPRCLLQTGFERATRRLGLPRGDRELAEMLAFSVHGMALARMDGVSAEAVARELERRLPA